MKNNFARLIGLLMLGAAVSTPGVTLTVTNSAESGDGTLRQAILDANADTSPDLVTIEFNIPGAGVQTIAPLTPLPTITRAVTIDGYTQSGASSNTLANADNAVLRIELDGTNVTSDNGLRFNANDCTVRGLVINGFSAQVLFESATNGVVEGNFLGTDAAGVNTNTVAGANGVRITGGANHRVGGLTPASRNVISGNWYVGVNVGACTGLQIRGNFIGIGADGVTTLPSGWGIYLTTCSQTQIGGTMVEARNVIAGGGASGCWIAGGEGNVIQGNFIGTDASGMLRRTNLYGLVLQESANNLVGGTIAAAGNLFSGNDTGIYLAGPGASNNVIAGNFIGPDVTGTNALGNTYYGVTIENAPNNIVGGLVPGARNVICGNDYAGVAVSYATATGNVIQGNYIGVDVTGTNALGNVSGIFISESPGNLIGGLTPASRNIIGGNQTGISLFVAGVNNQVFGNFIGLGADGLTVVSNRTGIGLHYCYQIQIGGPTPGARNVISGNGGGFHANQGGSNVIQGNFIGTDASGMLPRGNLNGVFLNESSHTLIGGTEAGAGNLISANSGIGLGLQGVNASNNVVAGNLIGTDVSGTNALGNGDYGVYLNACSGNVIGGATPGARNVVSGSVYAGIALFSPTSSGNVVAGNFVGTDVTGTNVLGNGSYGMLVASASGNVLGGTAPGAGNVVSGGSLHGIGIVYADATNNAVLGNSIFGNGALGIDLGADGLTPNDAGDADGSPNHFQNSPEMLSAVLSNGVLHVLYRVDSSAANSAYPLTVEFFISDGGGEGRTLIHRATYSTPQATASIAFTPLAALTSANRIVATATDANGNTSEFSGEQSVVGWFTITSTADSGPGSLRQAILDANADTSTEVATIGFNLPGAGVQTLLPLSVLPVITRPVTIDGYTQPGASPNSLAIGSDAVLLIELNGTNFPGSIGLSLVASASNSVVRGLVINRCTYGIGLDTAGSIIEGNFIGTDASGTNAQPNDIGIAISGTGNRIGGLTPGARNVISGNTSGRGIWFTLGTSNLIVGNYVGLGADGTTRVPNAAGIYVSGPSTGNQIGGTTPNARNVISANGDGCYDDSIGGNVFSGNFIGTDASGTLARGNIGGITVVTAGVIGGTNNGAGNLLSGWNSTAVAIGSSNVVAGNFIGTDVTGQLALGNEYDGVLVSGSGNSIGGTVPAARNVIAANRYGIFFFQPTANNNRVVGNYIGTDTTGTNALGNASGIVSLYAPLNVIGGSTAAEGNVISASTNGAIEFIEGATNNIVQGNFIGTDITGAAILPNGRGIGANTTGNLIGGTGVGEGNIIAGNIGIGVAVGETNNAILGNRIFANGALGIDLFGDGVNPNDPGDADSGPNHFQNFPEISSAALLGGDLTISYRVDSDVANSAYPLTVEFFLADSVVSGEGRALIHRHTYETPQTFTSITFTPTAPVNDGDPLVATATDANGNTSEFSAVAAASSNRSPVVANPIPDQTGTSGVAFSYTFPANTFSDPDISDTLSYVAVGLPSGVAFDGPTRTFSGAPTVTGIFAITVTAADNGTPSLSTNDVFNLTVLRAPITVTNLANSGAGTLRQAIADALPGDTIDFAITGTITLFGQLEIDKSLTIAGPGATNLTVRGNGGTRLFNVSAGPTVISGLTLAFGLDWFETQPGGGAIYNTAHLTVRGCALTRNQSTYRGGAVLNIGASATLIATGCTFDDNWMTWSDGGGAIWNNNLLRVTNCTFSANYSAGNGGAVDSRGDAAIASSTIVGNSADFGTGGGIYNGGGALALQNSIVANNYYFFHLYQNEVTGGITGGDYNLIQYTNDLVVPGTHNVLGLDPILSPLTDHGGPTRMHGLASISPAVEAADGASSPAVDQRGVPRPQGAGYDIGAFEGALPPNTNPTFDNPIPDQFTTYRAAFSYTIPANTFSDPDAGQALTYSVANLPPDLTFNPATRTISGTFNTAGTNTVTVTARDNGAPPLSSNTTFNIIAPKLLITAQADDASRIIGQFNPAFTIIYYGLAPGDGAYFIDNPPLTTTTADQASPPGTYPIALSGGSDDVYEFVGWTNGTLTVTLWPLRAEAASASRGTGQTNPPFIGILTGVIYGDNITATYTCAATAASPAGNYPITPVLNDPLGRLTNYDVTLINGTLTVESDAVNPNLEVLHAFGFTNRIGGTTSELIEGSDGWLYGTGGGVNTRGVFRIQKDGTGYLVVRNFSPAEGAPAGPLLEHTNGMLYGGGGSVWSMNRDGSGFTVLHQGAASGLLKASDGMLYGIGGDGIAGTVFRLNFDGSDYTVLHTFAASYEEGLNHSQLVEGTNGMLYGTASAGGPGGYYGDGTIYSLSKDGSNFSVLHAFTFGATDGAQPKARLLQASDGKLYGTTRSGGPGYGGTIFALNLDGSGYALVKTFDYYNPIEGISPTAPLIESGGLLFGTTTERGPTSYGGTAFKMNMDGSGFLVIKQFGPVPDLYAPDYGLLLASDGRLYGATSYGGLSDLLIGGGVFRMNQDGSAYSLLYPFSLSGEDGRQPIGVREASDGLIYGTTKNGGAADRGTVFRMNKNGSGYEVIHSFTGSPGDGRLPGAEVMEATDGLIYGTTSSGGTNDAGTVFRMNKDGSGYVVLHDFVGDSSDGAGPSSGLIEATNGRVYGVTFSGGSKYGGTIFSLNKDGSGYALVHEFDYAYGSLDGSYPRNTLVMDTNGVLFGTTSGGGSNPGNVFKLNTDGTGFTVLHDLNSAAGEPVGPSGLLLASDGALYGAGYNGVFKLNRDGTGFQVIHSFPPSQVYNLDASYPDAALAEGADGRIYGTTVFGGIDNSGTIFRLKKDGSDYSVLHRFAPPSVGGTSGPNKPSFFRASDGSLYATTGSDLNFGTVYRLNFSVNLPPGVVNFIADQNGSYGAPFNFAFAADTFGDPDVGQVFNYTAAGLPPGITLDNLSRLFTGSPTTNGIYTITVTATDNGVPPLSTNETFNLLVAKAPLTVTANNTNRPYGAADPAFTGMLVGVTNSDILTAAFTTTATPGSPPGDYAIVPALLDPDSRLGNYTVTTNNGTLTIQGVTLEFSAVGGSPAFCWPTTAATFLLEYTDNLTPPVIWHEANSGITTNGPIVCLTVTPAPTMPSRFYRLRLP